MTRTITVRGRGFAPARPTEAFLSLEVAAVRPTSAEAFAEAAERQAALDAWRVGADDPARLEACRLAAADAERRATVFAQALGLRRSSVLRVVEVGSSDLGREGPGPVSFGPIDAEPERPGTAEVSAAVDVAFELEARV